MVTNVCYGKAPIDDYLVHPGGSADLEQFRAIIEGLHEGVMAFDLGGNLLLINRAALKLYSFENQSKLRDNLSAIEHLFDFTYLSGEPVPVEDYPAARVVRGETFADYELWVRRRGTERRWLGCYTGTQVEDSITLGVLSLRDVTARRELEARARATFEINPTAITITRLADLRLTEVNQRFLELTGYTQAEVLGKTVAELKLDLGYGKREQALKRLRRGESDVVLEHEGQLRTKSGDMLEIVSEGRLISFSDDPHLIDTYIDVTARKQTDEAIHQAIQAVMSDTTWFTQKVMERLAHIRLNGAGTNDPGPVELSPRERQVLERLAQGLGNEIIARELGVAVQTIRNYISTLYSKLGVHSRAEAIVWARERGIVGHS